VSTGSVDGADVSIGRVSGGGSLRPEEHATSTTAVAQTAIRDRCTLGSYGLHLDHDRRVDGCRSLADDSDDSAA
jgi:hypothetical protein